MKTYEQTFLALLAWKEARGEEFNAKLGVIWSVINRVNAKKWYGKSIMEVIFKKLQYTSLTCVGDINLIQWPKEDENWLSCVSAAQGVAAGLYESPIKDSTHYHDISIGINPPPHWGKCEFVVQLGKLRFYRGIK